MPKSNGVSVRTVFPVGLLLACGLGLTACAGGKGDPGDFCLVRTVLPDDTETCTEGGVVLFQPATFGNAQLPVMFAAISCSLDHEVVITEGAVTCVFTRARHAAVDKAFQ
jgi:hypothetical protein